MREAIGTLHRLGAVQELAINFGRLANVLALSGDAASAGPLLAKSDAMLEELGATRSWWDRERNDATRQIIGQALDDSAFAQAALEGSRLTVDEAVALALEP